jgi:hypothetical protein
MRCLPRIVCPDGFSMSVQASTHHYCSPRSDVGPWTEVEVGYPNRIEPILFNYIEPGGDPWTESVYPHVPVEIVAEVIKFHGGSFEEWKDV